jgi:hypothetical protein
MPPTNTYQLFAFFPIILALLFYGLIFFCIWKFYQMLSNINNNLAGIRRAMGHGGQGWSDNQPEQS